MSAAPLRRAVALVLALWLAPVPAHADENRRQILLEAWRTVREHYFDPAMPAENWESLRQSYEGLAAAAGTSAELSDAINAMLGELRVSHNHHYTPGEPAYYQLLDIFGRGENIHRKLGRMFPNGDVRYEGIGIFTRTVAGRTFVSGVLENAPAQAGGLLRGDEVVAVDGQPFDPIGSFKDKAGQAATVAVRRVAGAEPQALTVTPAWLAPNKMFLEAMRGSVRMVERDGFRIGTIHPWSYAGGSYQRLLVEELAEGRLKDADALVLDLRDGWGGAQLSYLDPFIPNAPSMLRRDRGGETSYDAFRWRRPVVVLINEGTRSGKEILAQGIKEHGLGTLVGTRSAGAVLAAQAFLLGDDSLLLVPVLDVSLDGKRLEGVGVAPDVPVLNPLPYAQGADPQFERALAIAVEKLRANGRTG